MRKTALTLAMIFMACSFSQAQLLYRIEGNGLENPSYIVGTYHLAPAKFVDNIPGIKKAMETTKQVFGEVDMKETKQPENMAKMQEAMMLPDGMTLGKLLDKEQMEHLNELLREVMGVDMTNKAVAEQLERLSPMALEVQLMMLVYMQKIEGLDPMNLIDDYFQTEALKSGKRVGGLETAELQMKILYGDPLEKQVKDLMCFVDHFKEGVETAGLITEAYFAQSMERLEEVSKKEMEGPCGDDPAENERMLFERNANWVKVMPRIMKKAPTLFVVGAFHLCGERGVLKMLEAEGYKIEAVEK